MHHFSWGGLFRSSEPNLRKRDESLQGHHLQKKKSASSQSLKSTGGMDRKQATSIKNRNRRSIIMRSLSTGTVASRLVGRNNHSGGSSDESSDGQMGEDERELQTDKGPVTHEEEGLDDNGNFKSGGMEELQGGLSATSLDPSKFYYMSSALSLLPVAIPADPSSPATSALLPRASTLLSASVSSVSSSSVSSSSSSPAGAAGATGATSSSSTPPLSSPPSPSSRLSLRLINHVTTNNSSYAPSQPPTSPRFLNFLSSSSSSSSAQPTLTSPISSPRGGGGKRNPGLIYSPSLELAPSPPSSFVIEDDSTLKVLKEKLIVVCTSKPSSTIIDDNDSGNTVSRGLVDISASPSPSSPFPPSPFPSPKLERERETTSTPRTTGSSMSSPSSPFSSSSSSSSSSAPHVTVAVDSSSSPFSPCTPLSETASTSPTTTRKEKETEEKETTTTSSLSLSLSPSPVYVIMPKSGQMTPPPKPPRTSLLFRTNPLTTGEGEISQDSSSNPVPAHSTTSPSDVSSVPSLNSLTPISPSTSPSVIITPPQDSPSSSASSSASSSPSVSLSPSPTTASSLASTLAVPSLSFSVSSSLQVEKPPTPQLVQGSFDHILLWIIVHMNCGNESQPEDLRAFLLTYRTFAPPEELLDGLRQIHVQYHDKQFWDALRVRTNYFILEWVSRWATRDLSDQATATHLLDFSKVIMPEAQFNDLKNRLTYSKQQNRRSVLFRSDSLLSASLGGGSSKIKKGFLGKTSHKKFFPASTPVMSRSGSTGSLQAFGGGNGEKGNGGGKQNNFSLYDFKSLHIAQEITAVELELFLTIGVGEFLNQAWAGKNVAKLAPNLTRVADRFNAMSRWVATEIMLVAYTKKLQIKVLKKFIRIAQKLTELNNFNSMLQILAGIHNSAVERLKLQDELPSKYKDILGKLVILSSPMNNYRALRALEKSTTQSLPALAVFLRDLMFLEEGNPTLYPNGSINFEKQRMITLQISDFWLRVESFALQRNIPNNHATVALRKALKDPWHLSDDELYSCSLICEPLRNVKMVNLKESLQIIYEWLRGKKENRGKVRLVKKVPTLKTIVDSIRKKKSTLTSHVFNEDLVYGFLALILEWFHENQDEIPELKDDHHYPPDPTPAGVSNDDEVTDDEKTAEEQMKSMKAAVGFIDFLPQDMKELVEQERKEQIQKIVDQGKELMGQVSTWIKVFGLYENNFFQQMQQSRQGLLHEIIHCWISDHKNPEEVTEFLKTMEGFARNSVRF